MVKDVSGKGSWKEEFLALVFVVIFFISFVFVGWVDANWETTTTEQVWVSDGSAIIPHYPYHYDAFGVLFKGNLTTRELNVHGATEILNDSTSLYDGNNTWIASFQDTGTLLTTGSYIQQWFELIDANTFLINEIDYRLFYGIGQVPDDVHVVLATYLIDGEVDEGVDNADDDELATHLIETIVPTDEWDNGTAEVPLAVALDIYEKAQLDTAKVYLMFQFDDDNGHGLGDASWNAEVNGTYQKGLSARNMIYYGLGFSAGVNILVGLFMTDQIDMPKIKKALKRGGS